MRGKMRAVLAMLKKRKPRKLSSRASCWRSTAKMSRSRVRLNPRARRMVMRVHPVTGEVSVTAPARAGRAAALDFVRGETGWVAQPARSGCRKPVALAPGALVPFLGRQHRILQAAGRGPAPVWRQGDEILVSGRAEHAARRLIDFFKREAREAIRAQRAGLCGARLGVKPARITVRDTASRWGSCSSARSLSFSWRLIFAPDYRARICGGA